MATEPRIVDVSNADSTNTPPGEPLTIPGLDDCAKLSKEELLKLVERMSCQCGLVAAMTREQTAQAMLDVLAHTALKPIVAGLSMKADIQARMAAIDKWLDRERGKPAQTIKQDVDIAATITRIECVIIDPMVIGGKP